MRLAKIDVGMITPVLVHIGEISQDWGDHMPVLVHNGEIIQDGTPCIDAGLTT